MKKTNTMKSIVGLFLVLCMLLSLMQAQVFGVGSVEASQTEELTPVEAVDSDGDGFVEIDNAEKLWWFTHEVNGGNKSLNAELTANIDLSGTCGDGIGNWKPISHENGYTGNFNGQGFTISNLYIESDEQYAGLFGYVKDATIENVRVTGSVSSTFCWTYDPDTFKIFNGAVGGVVANLDGGTIRNCESDMTVTGGFEFGGICGRLSSGIIEDCINRGTIIRDLDSTYSVCYGGIVGHMQGGTVRGCTNQSEGIVGTYADIGGIVGLLSEGTVEKCINLSNIAATQYTSAGGIAGRIWIHGVIRNCGNYGTVTGVDAGGITAINEGIIEHCWNIAAVSGTSECVGPIAGLDREGYGTSTNCYYLSDTTTEDGGRTAEQFASGQVAYELNGSTITDTSVWKQNLGTDSYPTLAGDNVYYVASQKCDGTEVKNIYSNSTKDIIVHEYVDSVCTVCTYACTHSTHNDAGVCDDCQKQRGYSVTVGDSISYFDDMYEAFRATTTGTEQNPATIKLLTNVTHTTWRFGTVSKGAYVVLDLNGYTLTFTHEDTGIQVVGGSHFTLMDSSDGETGSIVGDYEEQYPTGSHLIRVSEQSTMILQGGRLVLDIYAAEAIHVIETSTLIQNGGVIEGTARVAVSVRTGSLFTQNGGTIISNGYAVGIEDDGSRYVLEGGTLFLNGNWASMNGGYFDFYESDGTVTINGGIFDAVGASDASISMPTLYMIGRGSYGDCKIIINAATFKKTDNADLCITEGCYDGTITIQFKNVVFENGLALYYPETQTLGEYLAPSYVYYDADGNVITLTEGMTELTGKITVAECTNHTGGTATCTTLAVCDTCKGEYGEYYHTDGDGDSLCDVCEGFMFPGSGTEQDPWQVDTYDELVAACIDNAFVKLVGDIEWIRGGNVKISGTTHLCLNGHTLNFANSCIRVFSGGVLTLCNCAENTGTITAYVVPIFNEGGTLVLSGDPIITNDSGARGAVTTYSGARIDAAAYTGGDVTVQLVRTTLGDVIVENVTEANRDKFVVTNRDCSLELTDEGTLVMAKAIPTANLFTLTPPANLDVCDGLAKEATVTVKDDVFGVGAVTAVKYFNGETQLNGAPMAVGTYTVKIDVAEGSDYRAIEDLTIGTLTVDTPNNYAHKGLMLKSNGDGTHDMVCTVCEKVISDDAECSYQRYIKNTMLISHANCTSPEIYYMSCACGQKNGETFEDGYINPNVHTSEETELIANNDGTHNVVHSCCKAVITENVACTPADCTKQSLCDCGYALEKMYDDHDFSGEYIYDENGHRRKCANCEQTDEMNYHEATDDGDCTTAVVCVCGYIFFEAKDAHIDEDSDLLCDNCFKPLGYFQKVSVSLGEDIKIKYYVDKKDLTEPKVKFTINDYTKTVDGVLEGDFYMFVFDGVAPQWMGDNIKAELLVNGVVLETKDYSVFEYLNTLRYKTPWELGMSDEKFYAMHTLIEDLLVYGGAAQSFKGHNTDKLVSEDACGTEYQPITAPSGVGVKNGDNVKFTGANLWFDSVNQLAFRFTATDIDSVTFKLKINDGTEITIDKADIKDNGDGTYTIMTDAIKATGFDDVYTITVYNNSDNTSQAKIAYSVKYYVYTKQNGTDAMTELAKALYNYGLSAMAFYNAE